MITGHRDDLEATGTFVLPMEDGSYACPPATCVETFWAYRRENGVLVEDDANMVLKYVVVDPVTMNIIEPEAKEVTAKMVGQWISTRLHPNFL